MKRILAVFLTLAMALNIAPVGALAAADSDAASIAVVEETDENASSQLDEETAKAVASDPFLQADRSARTEPEQDSQAKVDASSVTLTATNSFGQLLANEINEQNGTIDGYTSRITNIQFNGHIANVEFVTDKTADLVVAVYTDDAAEEMVASGTTEVSGDGGNSSAKVAITGNLPEAYTAKAFLLDKNDHAPLCSVYTDASHTQVMIDLSNATVDDFPEERVINLDENAETNFAVVNQDATLVTYDDMASGENQILLEDDAALVYTFGNASEEIRNLQEGDILVYEYAPGELLVARVESIDVSGDTVTICGDDTLDISEVFDAMKIENDADNTQLEYDESTADEGVTYLGEEDADFSFVSEEGGGWLDDTNGFSVSLDTTEGFKKDPMELTGKASKKFEFQAYSGSDSSADGDTTAQASISGTINVSMSVTSGFYIAKERKYFSLAANFAATADATASGSIEVRKRLGSFGFSPIAGCYVGIDPTFVSKAEVEMTFTIETSAKIGFVYDSANGGLQDASKAPYIALGAKATGSLYAGIDLSPNIKVLGKVTVLALKVEVGGTGSFSETVWSKGNEDLAEAIHGCSQCYTIDLKGSVDFGGSLTVLKKVVFDTTIYKKDWDAGNAYSAPDYNDFGWGKCPHQKYRVTISVSVDGSEGMTVYAASAGTEKTELGKIGPALVLVAYLDPGAYKLTATKDDRTYGANITVENAAQEVKLYWDGSGWIDQPTNPDPDKPDEPETPDYTLVNGRLTINKESIMLDYESAEDTPWYNSRNEIDRILTQYMVKKISSYAFADCNKVTEVYIGDEITEIGDYAFSGCSSLEKITFVGTMAKWKEIQVGIGNDVLNEVTIICSDGSINANAGEEILASGKCGEDAYWTLGENGVLIISGEGRMEWETSDGTPWESQKNKIKTVEIKQGITNTGARAFYGCSNLEKITIPSSVTEIGKWTFTNCSKLKNVDLPNEVTTLGEGAFNGCIGLTSIKIPAGVTKIEHATFSVSGLTSIEIPNGVTTIGDGAFYSTKLESATIPESVTVIDKRAFARCSNLLEVDMPNSIETIGVFAFEACVNLKDVEIPNKITKIDTGTFYACRSFENIVIPANVTEIEQEAFMDCSALKNVELSVGVTKIGTDAFSGCVGLTEVAIPSSVIEVRDGAFKGCTGLEKITIPMSVTVIEQNTFAGCSKLKSIELPSSIKSIEKDAFSSSGLISIDIPVGTKYIGESAFYWCGNLASIIIPDGVEKIGAWAFCGCEKLSSVVIPNGITKIEEKTFLGCKKLTSATLPVSVKVIDTYAFDNCGLISVSYKGTKAQWNEIIVNAFNGPLESTIVHCTDGDIVPDTENSITTGTAEAKGSTYYATFDNAKAGKAYTIIVSSSKNLPLEAGSLIYINQITADANGTLEVPFITAADPARMKYVAACASDESQPDNPGGDDGKPSSGGGDGGGAAIILVGGVVAVAAVAGVVLMLPVEVSGNVKLADQPVANANVQVLQGDAVKAETVTDANGHFAVKVRRGSYTLRVQWTDAEGQPVMRTVDFKAPNANVNVAA